MFNSWKSKSSQNHILHFSVFKQRHCLDGIFASIAFAFYLWFYSNHKGEPISMHVQQCSRSEIYLMKGTIISALLYLPWHITFNCSSHFVCLKIEKKKCTRFISFTLNLYRLSFPISNKIGETVFIFSLLSHIHMRKWSIYEESCQYYYANAHKNIILRNRFCQN